MARVKPLDNFTLVPNSLLNEKQISFKAKGLYAYLNSKKDDWNFTIDLIAKNGKDGRDSVASGLKELEDFGFLERRRYKDDKGYFDIEYILKSEPFEVIKYDNPSKENPYEENPYQENPYEEKADDIYNTINNNTINNNTIDSNNTPPQKKSKSKKEVEMVEEKFAFGEHLNVKLSLDEKEKLLQRWGADVFQQIVDKLSNYKLSSGTKYKSDYGAINNWVAKQVEKDNRFSKPLNNNNNGNSQSKSGKQYFNLEPGWSNLTGDEWWMRPYTYKGSTGEDDNVPK